MHSVIVLDSSPLGMLCNPNLVPSTIQMREWVDCIGAAGITLVIPEIADYEVRRELIRTRKQGSIRLLDSLKQPMLYLELTTAAMQLAAELWAKARQTGKPTGHSHSLDADVILAAQTILLDRQAIIATDNANHLSRYTLADHWLNLTP